MKASESRAIAISKAESLKQTSPSFAAIRQLIDEAANAGKTDLIIPMRCVKYEDWMVLLLQLDGYECKRGNDRWGYILTIKW